MKKTHRYIVLVLGLLIFGNILSQPLNQEGSNLVSFDFSRDYFKLSLNDNKTTTIDSIIGIFGMTDSGYISKRSEISSSTWSSSFGFSLQHNITKKISVQSGLKQISAKQMISSKDISDSLFMIVFSDQLNQQKFKTEYNFIELPFKIMYRTKGNDPYYAPLYKRGSYLSIGGGLGFSLTNHKTYYFNFLEHSKIVKNIGINLLLSANYNRQISDSWYFAIGVDYRNTLINNYVYAPVQSNYNSYGVTFKLGKFFTGKPIQFQSKSILECMSFEKERNFEFGLSSGLTTTFLIGPSIKSDFITSLRVNNLDKDNVVETTKKNYTTNTPYLGIYSTFQIKKNISLQISPSFSERKMRWKYDYTLKNEIDATEKYYSRLKVKLYYFDIPVSLNFKKGKHTASFGLSSSILLTDKILEYQFSKDFSNNSPDRYFAYSKKNRILNYFGLKANDNILGYILGYQYAFDNWASLSIEVHHTNEIFNPNFTRYNFNMLNLRTGINFFLYKKTK